MSITDPNAPIEGGAMRGRLILQPGSTCTDNEFGTDVLLRSYICFTDEVGSLVPARGSADDFYPGFIATDRTIQDQRGLLSLVTVTYKGILGEDLPPPNIEGGWSEATAQLSIIKNKGDYATNGFIDLRLGDLGGGIGGADAQNRKKMLLQRIIRITAQNQAAEEQEFEASLEDLANEESGEVSVTYNSPTTTYMYVSRKEPKKPKYRGKLLTSDGDFEITDLQPASFTGRPACNREIRTIDFKKKKVGGFWEVLEVNQGLLVNIKVAMRPMPIKFDLAKSPNIHSLR